MLSGPSSGGTNGVFSDMRNVPEEAKIQRGCETSWPGDSGSDPEPGAVDAAICRIAARTAIDRDDWRGGWDRPCLWLSGGSRLGVAQSLEPGKLVCEQFALFIAPDKDLEHGAAIEVDELQRTGAASEK